MHEMPWMRPDFDLGRVMPADASGALRSSMERALDGMEGRLQAQRSLCRDAQARERIDALLDACTAARQVLAAACDAALQA